MQNTVYTACSHNVVRGPGTKIHGDKLNVSNRPTSVGECRRGTGLFDTTARIWLSTPSPLPIYLKEKQITAWPSHCPFLCKNRRYFHRCFSNRKKNSWQGDVAVQLQHTLISFLTCSVKLILHLVTLVIVNVTFLRCSKAQGKSKREKQISSSNVLSYSRQ